MTHNQLIGITITIAGIISAIGNSLTLIILNPVAIIKKPAQALKSLIIAGVVNGKINFAHKNKIKKITNCGMAITDTTYPKLQAKIAAVKKSRIDLEIKTPLSPVIPEVKEP